MFRVADVEMFQKDILIQPIWSMCHSNVLRRYYEVMTNLIASKMKQNLPLGQTPKNEWIFRSTVSSFLFELQPPLV